jgi:hypothetical protein
MRWNVFNEILFLAFARRRGLPAWMMITAKIPKVPQDGCLGIEIELASVHVSHGGLLISTICCSGYKGVDMEQGSTGSKFIQMHLLLQGEASKYF